MDSHDGNSASSGCRINTVGGEDDGKMSSIQNDEEEDDETTSGLESLKRGSQLQVFDCPVCLQNASFPVQLPCHHIFCFLCVKGVAQRDKRCAMCRQPIPSDFFNDPKLLCYDEIKKNSETIFDEGYQWFYEGRNGWWQYDERTSVELEKRYKKGDKILELLIAGFLYVIDLENMRQYRRNDASRRRRVRRDLRNIPGIKGIAGLRYNDTNLSRPSGDGGEAAGGSGTTTAGAGMMATTIAPVDGNTVDDSYLTPSAPNNTPQTPMTPADSQPGSLSGSQEDLSVHLQNLHLNQNTNAAMPHHSHSSIPPPDLYFRFRSDQNQTPPDLYATSRHQAADGHPLSYDKEEDDGEEDEEHEDEADSQLFNVTHNSENSDDSITLPNMSREDERDDFVRGEVLFGDDHPPTRRFPRISIEEEEEDEDEEEMGAAADRARSSPRTTTKHGKYETRL